MGHFARAALAGLVLCGSLPATAADPVAFVSDIRGDVVLDGGGRPPFLAELLPGSRLVLGTDAGAAVMYVVSGEEYSLRGPGEFVVGRQGVSATRGAAPSSRVPAQQVSASVLVKASRAATASLRMRSAPAPKAEQTGLAYPVNARIATLQPTLRWSGKRGGVHSVVVTSTAGKEVFRGNATATALRLPVHLVAGQRYSWSVAAGAEIVGASWFELLPADTIAAAEKARAGARSFSDRVLLALVLQDLGAPGDAREVWMQLAAERPDIPELAGLAR